MTGSRRCVSFAILLPFIVLCAACSDSDNNIVAPSPTPTPTPPAATFTVTGTISETAPTTGTRVEGVQVTIGGASGTTNADGVFTVAGVAAGSHTLSASKAEYVTQTRAVTVTSANVSGIQMNLAPTPRRVHNEFDGRMRGDGPSCAGTSRSCHVYPAGAHNTGRVEAFIAWSSDDAIFDLELRCDGDVVEESIDKGDGKVREINVEVRGGRACELHVIFTGDEATYGLFLTHPY